MTKEKKRRIRDDDKVMKESYLRSINPKSADTGWCSGYRALLLAPG
jgi:hypothetical protein